MKTLIIFIFCFFFTVSLFPMPELSSLSVSRSIVRTGVNSNGNNISTWVLNTGVFNQDIRTNNTPGFEWTKGSGKFAIFTSGLSMAVFINNFFRTFSCSYNGELVPGYVLNRQFVTSSVFKLYKVSRGDNSSSNSDYANWGLMVPYGAPFDDVNGNGIFDEGIDKPGVKNAAQTIFVCLTDADSTAHVPGEGFSGGTPPTFAEVHLSVWSYDNITALEDVQFLKMDVINKNNLPWQKTYFSLYVDADLGDAVDDYIGCDVGRNLAYCYNSDNQDGSGNGTSYGANPPAVGIDMLKGAVNRNVSPNADLYMTSSVFFSCASPVPCENLCPTGNSYNFMKGLKSDGTSFINPVTMSRTKFCYPGDPETGTGWTEYTGKINNCGGDTTGAIVASEPGDRRYIMNSGADNLTIVPGEKQTFVFAQLIARGTDNKNSVTKLKQLDDAVQIFYSSNFNVGINSVSTIVPDKFSLHQNYPNPFNPSTKIKFDLNKSGFASLKIYDVSGREISALVNRNLNAGSYEFEFNALNLPSGVYFYKLETTDFSSVKKMSLIK